MTLNVVTENYVPFGATDTVAEIAGNDSTIEKVIGTAYGDDLLGSDGDEWLVGGGGKDVLDGGADEDTYEVLKGDGGTVHIVDTGGHSKIVLQGYDAGEITVTRDGDNMQFRIGGAGGAVVGVAYKAYATDTAGVTAQTMKLGTTTTLGTANPVSGGSVAAPVWPCDFAPQAQGRNSFNVHFLSSLPSCPAHP